jgi:ATP-dependent Clp protease ATP-binding subunit ClpA
LLVQANDEAKQLKDDYTSVEHLLLAMVDGGGPTGRLFKELGLTRERLMQVLQEVRGHQRVTSPNPEATYEALERYGRDLTQLAEQGKLDPVIGRDDEIRRVIQVLSRRTKNNPVLIGEPGVGKTAIVEGLAQRIVRGDVPEGLKHKRIVALDMGALIAGHGRTVDFKNTIVIMTSNIGSPRILEYRGAFEGEPYAQMKQAVLEELRYSFRPEFLNRVDEIIVFHALSEEHLKQIVEIQLGGLRARLAERHIQLDLTEAARTSLVRAGYNPSYGARPLKRVIQKEVETPLARMILKGEVRDGQSMLVDYDPERGELQFTGVEEAVAAER